MEATVGAYSENANTLSEMLNDGEIRQPQPVGNHQRRLPGIVGDPVEQQTRVLPNSLPSRRTGHYFAWRMEPRCRSS